MTICGLHKKRVVFSENVFFAPIPVVRVIFCALSFPSRQFFVADYPAIFAGIVNFSFHSRTMSNALDVRDSDYIMIRFFAGSGVLLFIAAVFIAIFVNPAVAVFTGIGAIICYIFAMIMYLNGRNNMIDDERHAEEIVAKEKKEAAKEIHGSAA